MKEVFGICSTMQGCIRPTNTEFIEEIVATEDGYVAEILTDEIGMTSLVLGGGRETKESVLAYLMEQTPGIEKALMIGDTDFDVVGANAHHIPTLGVSWGFGSRESMIRSGALAVADTPEELYSLILEAVK